MKTTGFAVTLCAALAAGTLGMACIATPEDAEMDEGETLAEAQAAITVTYPLPETGHHSPGFQPLTDVIQTWAQEFQITGVTAAVVRDKRLVYEKGFGYQGDTRLSSAQEIYPDAKMRLATTSCAISHRALRQIVEDGVLTTSTTLASALGSTIAPTATFADSRMAQITVGDILNNRTCFSDVQPSVHQFGVAMGLDRHATLAEVIRYKWTLSQTMIPTPCQPGMAGNGNGWTHYQFEVAAQIIAMRYYAERVAAGETPTCNPGAIDNASDQYADCVGWWYGRYVSERIGAPLGIELHQAKNTPGAAFLREVWYDERRFPQVADPGTDTNSDDPADVLPEWNRYDTTNCLYDSGNKSPCRVPRSYAIDFFARPGSGTIVTSARDLARFATIYSQSTGLAQPTNLASVSGQGTYIGGFSGTRSSLINTVVYDSSGLKHPVTVVVLANRVVQDVSGAPYNKVPLETRINSVLAGTSPAGTISWPTDVDLFNDVRIKNYLTSKYMQLDSSGAAVLLQPLATSGDAGQRQRWRVRRASSGGYDRIVNAGLSTGMISNEHNLANVEYQPPNTSWWSEQWTIAATGSGDTKYLKARWWNTHRMYATSTGTQVQQGDILDGATSGFWSLEPVPSGATSCSSSSTAPSCLCTNASGSPCSCGTAGCPAYWTCSKNWYGTNDGCDCGCGGWDPDCDLPNSWVLCQSTTGTTLGTSCSPSTLQCQ